MTSVPGCSSIPSSAVPGSRTSEGGISRHPGTESTRLAYRNILNARVGPVLGDRTLASVAQARDDVLDLLTVRLGEGGNSRRKTARALITGALNAEYEEWSRAA
jgi:hypothetical protein